MSAADQVRANWRPNKDGDGSSSLSLSTVRATVYQRGSGAWVACTWRHLDRGESSPDFDGEQEAKAWAEKTLVKHLLADLAALYGNTEPTEKSGFVIGCDFQLTKRFPSGRVACVTSFQDGSKTRFALTQHSGHDFVYHAEGDCKDIAAGIAAAEAAERRTAATIEALVMGEGKR